MTIRFAEARDIETMVRLSDVKRTEYEKHSPVFWRRADHANELQSAYFRKLLHHHDWIPVVHDNGTQVDGYIVGQVADSPPVYDMGGKACLIHDFVVERPELWEHVGTELLQAIEAEAKKIHAAVSVVVCGAHDEAKRNFLSNAGLHVASEWYVHALNE